MLTLAMPAGPARADAAPPRWLKAVAVSLALHAALVMLLRPSAGGQPSVAESPALVARLIAVTTPSPWAREADTATTAMPAVAAATPPAVPPAATSDRLVMVARSKDARTAPSGDAARPALAGDGVALLPPLARGGPPTAEAFAPAAAPKYLGPAGVDSLAQPLAEVEPVCPPEADRREVTVVMKLLISETGHVDAVSIVRSFPIGLCDGAAATAIAATPFAPATLRGAPVASEKLVEFHLTPINRGPAVSGRSF